MLLSTLSFDDFSTKRVDLHCHTNCSDGGLTPQELINRATNLQIDVLAITDHDTINALDIAQRYIVEQNVPIRLISGIEISTTWHGFEIHVVGLNLDATAPALTDLTVSQQQAREQRALQIGEKLAKCGFDDIYQQAKASAGAGSITRAHFAKVLLQQGHVSTMQKAFDKYLGKGQRAFVKPNWCTIEQAIAAIHQAGGSAVLAHPIRYDLSGKWLRRLIVDFKQAGGDALEVVLPQMANEQRKLMLNYCSEYDLHASLGSDFHYPNKWSDLGKNLKLPEQAKPVWQLWSEH
jgi:3',5'-nucleoside bisphosphate phosphatase